MQPTEESNLRVICPLCKGKGKYFYEDPDEETNFYEPQTGWKECRTCYGTGKILRSKASEFYNRKGLALRAQGKYDEAVKAYDKAIRLNPEENRLKVICPICEGKGKYYYEDPNEETNFYEPQTGWKECPTCYCTGKILRSKASEFYYRKGLALRAQGKYDEAIKAYDEAHQIKSRRGSGLVQQRRCS